MVNNYLNNLHWSPSGARSQKPAEAPDLPEEGPDVWIEKGYPSGPTEPAKPEPEPPEPAPPEEASE